MKKLAVVILLLFAGVTYSQVVKEGSIEGYWFGNAMQDKTAGMVMCDNDLGVAYLGLYSQKKIPGLTQAHACNLAISMNQQGEASLQVIDPADGHIYNVDLVKFAKEQNKEN